MGGMMTHDGIGRLIEYAHEILDLADCVIGDTRPDARFDLAHYRRSIGERGSDEAFARMLHDARREALGCPHAAMADAAVAGLASVIRSLTGIDRDGLVAAREKLAEAIDEVRLHKPVADPAEIKTQPSGYLGVEALAAAFGISADRFDAFKQALTRKRAGLGNAVRELTDRRPNDPRFLYDAADLSVRAIAAKYAG
jgi:hypothetical protein